MLDCHVVGSHFDPSRLQSVLVVDENKIDSPTTTTTTAAAMKTLAILYQLASACVPMVLIYVSPPGTGLFSWHPVLMSLAIALLMGQAVVIFNSAFDLFTPGRRSSQLTWHWCLQAAAVVCLYAGFGVIYTNKMLQSKPHFATWHGVIGVATVIGAGAASVGGVAAKYGLKFPPLIRPVHIKWMHSIAGTIVFTLGCTTLLLGLASNWALNQMNRLERCGAGSLVVFMLLVVWYLAKKNYLFKVFQSK